MQSIEIPNCDGTGCKRVIGISTLQRSLSLLGSTPTHTNVFNHSVVLDHLGSTQFVEGEKFQSSCDRKNPEFNQAGQERIHADFLPSAECLKSESTQWGLRD